MFFILLLGFGTLLLASVSGFFSIWGLAYNFAAHFWPVIAMGIALEFGKLISVSFLYRFWKKVKMTLKMAYIIPILILMLITGTGHYAYLSSGYQTDVLPFKQIQEQVILLTEEKDRKIDRKKQIDKQIEQLPSNFVRGRQKLINQFKAEQEQVTARVNEIDKQILDLKTQSLKSEAHVGPIIFISKALGVEVDKAMIILILLIVSVFDPLAVLLTLATNIAIREREEEKSKKVPAWTTDEPKVDLKSSFESFQDKYPYGRGSLVTELPEGKSLSDYSYGLPEVNVPEMPPVPPVLEELPAKAEEVIAPVEPTPEPVPQPEVKAHPFPEAHNYVFRPRGSALDNK